VSYEKLLNVGASAGGLRNACGNCFVLYEIHIKE
jgi:hypothetical protein